MDTSSVMGSRLELKVDWVSLKKGVGALPPVGFWSHLGPRGRTISGSSRRVFRDISVWRSMLTLGVKKTVCGDPFSTMSLCTTSLDVPESETR